MTTIDIARAQAEPPELIRGLAPGEERMLTENDKPVAKLVAEKPPRERKPRKFGALKGTVLYVSPDFDAPIELVLARRAAMS